MCSVLNSWVKNGKRISPVAGVRFRLFTVKRVYISICFFIYVCRCVYTLPTCVSIQVKSTNIDEQISCPETLIIWSFKYEGFERSFVLMRRTDLLAVQ
jgi:dolichyl-phosphate-mannose--protein O-mannosyl transferase